MPNDEMPYVSLEEVMPYFERDYQRPVCKKCGDWLDCWLGPWTGSLCDCGETRFGGSASERDVCRRCFKAGGLRIISGKVCKRCDLLWPDGDKPAIELHSPLSLRLFHHLEARSNRKRQKLARYEQASDRLVKVSNALALCRTQERDPSRPPSDVIKDLENRLSAAEKEKKEAKRALPWLARFHIASATIQ